MQVIMAYVFVVIIWATTPLAIQWSNSSLTFILSVSLRMLLALVVCVIAMLVLKKPLIKERSDWKAFTAGALGLYPNMILVYWCAQFIPSGLMSVILGVYPFAVGIFSLLFFKENIFSPTRIVALIVAIIGLGLIHVEQLAMGSQAIYGVLGMMVSAFIFGLSSVWLKAVGQNIDPLRQSTGVLLLSVPAFCLTWYFLGGAMPEAIDLKSILGLGYLSLAGTVIGHTLFFYVLKHCSVFLVSLITLITPLMAMSIGYIFANEALTSTSIAGSLLVVGSLLVYQGVFGTLFNMCTRFIRYIFAFGVDTRLSRSASEAKAADKTACATAKGHL